MIGLRKMTEVRAFEGQAAQFGIAESICRIDDLDHPSMGGSCVPIRLGDRFFLATAGHVIKNRARLGVGTHDGIMSYVTDFANQQTDEDADLGFLEVSATAARQLNCAFLQESVILSRIDGRRILPVLVIGCPGALIFSGPQFKVSESVTVNQKAYVSCTYQSSILPKKAWPKGLFERPFVGGRDLLIHHFVEGPMSKIHPERAGITAPRSIAKRPRPEGCSGGGIWIEFTKANGVWRPLCKLAGIQTALLNRPLLLRGTAMSAWLRLIAKDYPDLKEVVDSINRRSDEFWRGQFRLEVST
jgi:hypothetical protein